MASYFKSNYNPQWWKQQREEVDPMSSMGNMGDIMLVFACGLMVALVVAWNVDLGKFAQVEMGETTEVDSIEQVTEMLYGEGNAFVEKGTVYQDPTTGKYYLVETGAAAESVSEGEGAGESGSDAEAGAVRGAGSGVDSGSEGGQR